MPTPRRVALASTLLLLGTAGAVRAAKEPPKPAALPPEVALSISAGSTSWTLQVRNEGTVPLRLDADARLLRLEISPPAAASASSSASGKPAKNAPKPPPPTVCELPLSMRAEGRPLVLAPGERYLEAFDPRLLCLDAASKLEPGARVTATLGWAAGKGAIAPPFVIAPVVSASASGSASASASASAPKIASAKEIAAPAFVVPPRASSSASASASASASSSASAVPAPVAGIVAKGGAARSVGVGRDAIVTIVVTNEAASPRAIYARPGGIGAMVVGPRGDRTFCSPGLSPAPIVDFVITLGAKGSWSGDTRLETICPAGVFDRPGLYEVWPYLQVPPLPWKADAYAGTLRARTPQLIRVETGKLPYHDAPPLAVASASAKP